jgi:hypothetical protein
MRIYEVLTESSTFSQMPAQQIVAVAQDTFAQLYPGVKLYGRSVVEGVGLTTAKGQQGAASAFASSDTVRGAFYLTLNAYAEGNAMIVVIEDATAGQYKGAATAVIKSLFEAGERLYQTEQRELVVNDNANAEAWNVIADRVGAEMMESQEEITEGIDFTNAVNSIEKLIKQNRIEFTSYEDLLKFVAGRKFLQAQRNDQKFVNDVARAVLNRLHQTQLYI